MPKNRFFIQKEIALLQNDEILRLLVFCQNLLDVRRRINIKKKSIGEKNEKTD